jgi:hypothetical protein
MYSEPMEESKGQINPRYTNAKLVDLTVVREIAAESLSKYKGTYIYHAE